MRMMMLEAMTWHALLDPHLTRDDEMHKEPPISIHARGFQEQTPLY